MISFNVLPIQRKNVIVHWFSGIKTIWHVPQRQNFVDWLLFGATFSTIVLFRGGQICLGGDSSVRSDPSTFGGQIN